MITDRDRLYTCITHSSLFHIFLIIHDTITSCCREKFNKNNVVRGISFYIDSEYYEYNKEGVGGGGGLVFFLSERKTIERQV